MRKGLIVGLLTSVMFLSFASLVFAAENPFELQTLPTTVTNETTFFNVIKNAANIIFTALIILAAVFILLAAFQFVTGGGNAEALEQARGKLIWAVVGVGVALLAQAIPTVVRNILNVT